jgi:hypothetical protein
VKNFSCNVLESVCDVKAKQIEKMSGYSAVNERLTSDTSDYGNLVNYNTTAGSRIAFQAPIAKMVDYGSHRAGLHRTAVVVRPGVQLGGSGRNARYLTRAAVGGGRVVYSDPNYMSETAAYGPV